MYLFLLKKIFVVRYWQLAGNMMSIQGTAAYAILWGYLDHLHPLRSGT